METTAMQKGEEKAIEKRRLQSSDTFYMPHVDIHELEDRVILIADMPGVDEGSVDVSIEDDLLTIDGMVSDESPEGFTLSHREYRTGSFRREFRISSEVVREKITAEVKDGLLKLVLPKAETVKSYKVEVSG